MIFGRLRCEIYHLIYHTFNVKLLEKFFQCFNDMDTLRKWVNKLFIKFRDETRFIQSPDMFYYLCCFKDGREFRKYEIPLPLVCYSF